MCECHVVIKGYLLANLVGEVTIEQVGAGSIWKIVPDCYETALSRCAILNYKFLLRDAMPAVAFVCLSDLPSVRPSVCLSDTSRYCIPKRLNVGSSKQRHAIAHVIYLSAA